MFFFGILCYILFLFGRIPIANARNFEFSEVLTLDKADVKVAFAKLAAAHNHYSTIEKFTEVWNTLMGKNEVCNQTPEEMILTCGFLLLNRPIMFNLIFQESTKIACEPQPFNVVEKHGTTLMSGYIPMYACPFVLVEQIESSEKTVYFISEGLKKHSALIYRRDSDTGPMPEPIGLVDNMINGKKLLECKEDGILSEYGKFYISLNTDPFGVAEESQKWSNFVKQNRDKILNNEEIFDICQISPRYQIYLCIQMAQLLSSDGGHFELQRYTYRPCEETLPHIFMFQCPRLYVDDEYDLMEVEYKYYLSGSVKKNMAIQYIQVLDGKVHAEAVVEDIDLKLLEEMNKTHWGYEVNNVSGLAKEDRI